MGELYGGLTQIDFMKGLAGMANMAPILAVLQEIGMGNGCSLRQLQWKCGKESQ
jgi:hypothetical protein